MSTFDSKTTTMNNCVACGIKTSKRCGKCKLVHYCGGSCQRQHWEIHQHHCAILLDLCKHGVGTLPMRQIVKDWHEQDMKQLQAMIRTKFPPTAPNSLAMVGIKLRSEENLNGHFRCLIVRLPSEISKLDEQLALLYAQNKMEFAQKSAGRLVVLSGELPLNDLLREASLYFVFCSNSTSRKWLLNETLEGCSLVTIKSPNND